MASSKLYLNVCASLLLFGIASCEVFQCNSQESYYSVSCTIEDADCTEATIFELQNHHNPHGINKLEFINSRVSYIPHGIFTKLPHLQWFDFSSCHLLEIVRYDFIHAANLLDLNLSHNHLDELKESIFYGAVNVNTIDLSYNKITRVSNNTFKSLDYLMRINLSNNNIKIIESNVFLDLSALRYIDLSQNIIRSLNDGNAYAKLNLTELDLSENYIEIVDQRVFENTKFIKILNLNYNSVKNLSFGNVTINIEYISIDNNNLTILETNDNLRQLDASNNQLNNANLIIGHNLLKLTLANNLLTNLKFIKNLLDLTHLDVSFNTLDQIQPDTFTQLIKLKSLSLERVNLKNIDFQMFSELKQLVILDISYNDLESINFHKLSFLEKLAQLYIDGNLLTRLNLDDFEFLFPNLETIDVSENNWPCDDLIVMLKRFKQLNIQIYVDESRLVKHETNIRGIQCNDQNSTNIEHLIPKIPIIHNHTKNDNYMFEINQTRLQLNTLQLKNDQLRFELNEMRLALENITITTATITVSNTNSTRDDFDKHDGQIANLTDIISVQINTLNTQINLQNDQFKTISMNDQGNMKSINGDLQFIKLMLIGWFILGMILVAVKIYTRLRYQRSYHPSYNTMANVLNENNI